MFERFPYDLEVYSLGPEGRTWAIPRLYENSAVFLFPLSSKHCEPTRAHSKAPGRVKDTLMGLGRPSDGNVLRVFLHPYTLEKNLAWEVATLSFVKTTVFSCIPEPEEHA